MSDDAATGVMTSDPDKKGKDGTGAADQERSVPLSALEAVRKDNQSLKTQLAQVQGTVDGLKAGRQSPPEPPKKVWTRAELREQVTAGKISEDAMDAILERQLEEKLAARTDDAINNKSAVTQLATAVGAQIEAYKDAFPDVMETDSDIRGKIAKEFDWLTKNGHPNDTRTELAAMRSVLGPLGQAKAGTRRKAEHHAETGGAGDKGGDDDAPAGKAWTKDLTPKQRDYYEKQISKGVYSGAADPKLKKELEFARKVT